MRKCLISLVIREMQIKLQWGISLYRVVIFKKTTNNKCCWGCREKGTFSPWFLKKLKTELPYNPIIPLLSIYLNKNTNTKRDMHPHVHCSIITIGKIWKQPNYPSMDEWIKKYAVYTYIHNAVLFSNCNNMDGPYGHYARLNKSHRKRQILHDLTCL